MFPFCPHCGHTLDQPQPAGQTIVCAHCGKPIGVVPVPQQVVVIDKTEELIRGGTAARCPLCGQVVEVKTRTTGRTYVPHQTAAPQRRMCPNSGKPLAAESPSPPAAFAPPAKTPVGKDLRALMTRDVIRVVLCPRAADPRIEELTLEYLDKADRVRLQIEALREILGPDFRMNPYPPPLNRPHLAVWGSATICVVGRKHARGGYETMGEAEVTQAVSDLQQHRQLFFA